MKKEYHICIDGKDVPVTEEVYYTYKRPAWKDRKRRQARADKERSLDAYLEDGFDIPSGQTLVEQIVEDELMLDVLVHALGELTEDEYDLLYKLFYIGQSEREVAASSGVSQQAVNKKKRTILDKLCDFLKNKNNF